MAFVWGKPECPGVISGGQAGERGTSCDVRWISRSLLTRRPFGSRIPWLLTDELSGVLMKHARVSAGRTRVAMKTHTSIVSLAAVVLSLFAGCQNQVASSAALDDGRVSVEFVNPQDFTDFKDSFAGTERGREDLEYQIRRTVAEAAAPLLKEGQRLTITFTDIDLAGDFLPSAHTGRDFRVVKPIYSPRMNFRYQITDANGAVVRQGEQRLHDTAFQYRSGVNRSESLYYDKEMLRDWIRSELGRA
jgi:hypothetical protein